MAIDALVQPLLRLPLFKGLKPLQLTEIVRRASRIIYKPGDVLVREDEVGDAAIIIVSGEALKLPDEDGQAAETVPTGSMVAELAMLVETVHSATIVARTPIKALKISREDMHAQMEEDPALAEFMMSRIAGRLDALVQEIRAIDSALAVLAETPAAALPGAALAPQVAGPQSAPLH